MSAPPPFLEFLRRGCEAGGFGTDDVLAAVLPLFEQVGTAHDRDWVAPLQGIDSLRVDDGRLWLEESGLLRPRKQFTHVDQVQKTHDSAVEIVGELRRHTDVDQGPLAQRNLRIGALGEAPGQPVFLPGYVAWEHLCGHHDPLTDIFSLGLILASLACSIDLTDPEELESFVAHRENLFALNERIHPVVAATVAQMTELNRHRRAQSVEGIVRRLRHYRDQTVDFATDFRRLRGFRESAPTERGPLILGQLRNRLFEISRRNRLLYFKPTLQTLNLTLASVPLLLDHRHLQPEQLFLWHDRLAGAIKGGESIVLGNYLRFEDAPYAPGVLDQIIATARRDRNEFGFAQLRLVVCFLRWHNLKEEPQERIHSPLLLLPVELTRKKGVRDAYVLKATTTEAEVNPALRHHLKQLYGLDLPEIVDLAETTLDAFHALLSEQIRASEPGVTLTKLDRPQIQLIHERARQRLDQFRKRQRQLTRGVRQFDSFDYSYAREHLRPLGIQIFLNRIKPARAPFADVAGQPPAPRRPHIVDPEPAPTPGVTEKETQLYALRTPEAAGNPYSWDFDLCSFTLGNFNYRKMSLVQDYAALLERPIDSPSFDALFATQPRPAAPVALAPLPLAEQVPVVDCDPTQALAVARARRGDSYIIQGPPGTGKSQTITNLIASYVARQKRVLFVCEKRAAIDVVYHRLNRQGLGELCCLIHDSQTDKRDFIRDLKQTYEAFLNQPTDDALAAQRTELLRLMELETAALQRWTDGMQARVETCSLTVRDLLARLVALRSAAVELTPIQAEQVPGYPQWEPHAEIVRSLTAALHRLGGAPTLAEHSFRHLTREALESPRPIAAINAAVDESARLQTTIDQALAGCGDGAPLGTTFTDLDAAVALAETIAPLAAADALDLLSPRGPRSRSLAKATRDWRTAAKALDKAKAATAGWKNKLPSSETEAALALTRRFDGRLMRWFNPAFWRTRKVLQERYDFSRHAIPPSWTQILTDLQTEHAATATCAQTRGLLEEACGELDTDTGLALLERLATDAGAWAPAARALLQWFIENPEATYVVETLTGLRPTLTRLGECLGLVMGDHATLTRAQLTTELQQLRADLVWLPDVLPVLAEALRLPDALKQSLQQLPLTDHQLEAAMARKSLAGIYQQDRLLEATDGRLIGQRVARLQKAHREWMALNASWIRHGVRRAFLKKVQLSSVPAAQLAPADKELKRLYATGRRELEHEFAKTMRHRSIRDLAGDETGVVLRDLKPVWLMSPLSVSDTLPLLGTAFDVVIFDEASQIPVEEAMPAVFRAPQVIVVGDEMQLPPTNFFSAARADDELVSDGEEGGTVAADLDADSFLTQASRYLPATMLGWHYRSRSEALISYSNHAFYEGRLLTIPDRKVLGPGAGEILVGHPDEGRANVDALLARSASFHFLGTGVYERRCNTMEADYLAALVRELLARETGLSIGIVAFSEAQQGEIEGALRRLAVDDAAFRNRLEAEYEREADGQFCGLFIKNLENVQGDERDIILLSVCYGYDRNRRMLMNFGPINQRGGEKRLNVIISRARHHMAVISSIRHFDITNDYNDGANCLRNFLEYAAACSSGDLPTARRVLNTANPLGGGSPAATAADDLVTEQIAAALRKRGWLAETQVGQSTFRLPLAIRRPGAEHHALAVMIDDRGHYAQRDVIERFLLRPGVLQAFGWSLLTVFTKDWLHDPDGVLRQIEQAMENPASLTPPEEPAAAAPPTSPIPGAEPGPESVPALPAPAPATGAAQSEPVGPGPNPASPEPARPPVLPSPPPRPVEVPVPGVVRRFESTAAGADKFWEIHVTGTEVTLHYGRRGTKGQTQTKAFANGHSACNEQERLIRSKLAKGYVEVG